jgi:hypothetical protein
MAVLDQHPLVVQALALLLEQTQRALLLLVQKVICSFSLVCSLPLQEFLFTAVQLLLGEREASSALSHLFLIS